MFEDYFWFLLLVGPASQRQSFATDPLNTLLDSSLIDKPPPDAFKHPKNIVLAANAHKHLEQVIILQEVKPLKFDPFVF